MVENGRGGEGLTVVVGADLERLVPSHDEAYFVGLVVLEEPNVARPAFFPLAALPDESEQFRSPATPTRVSD